MKSIVESCTLSSLSPSLCLGLHEFKGTASTENWSLVLAPAAPDFCMSPLPLQDGYDVKGALFVRKTPVPIPLAGSAPRSREFVFSLQVARSPPQKYCFTCSVSNPHCCAHVHKVLQGVVIELEPFHLITLHSLFAPALTQGTKQEVYY